MKLLVFIVAILGVSATLAEEEAPEGKKSVKRGLIGETAVLGSAAGPTLTGGASKISQPINNGFLYQNGGNLINREVSTHFTVNRQLGIPFPQPVPFVVDNEVPVSVPHPVPVAVDRPYPVPVSKPYTVTIEKPVPVQVHKPYPVPYPVPVKIHVPYEVKVPVTKLVPYKISKPIPVPVPDPIIVKKHSPRHYHVDKVLFEPIHGSFPENHHVKKYIFEPVNLHLSGGYHESTFNGVYGGTIIEKAQKIHHHGHGYGHGHGYHYHHDHHDHHHHPW